jgi:1-acyl-sn-glycerol-3-phosphate acyltransferase
MPRAYNNWEILEMKPVIKVVDRTFGHLARAFLRNWIVHPVFVMLYRVEIRGGEAALSCKDTGAIVVPNHTSRIDGPFLISMAWPHARIRPTAWHAEFNHWAQKWLMVLFSTIPLGSPKEPPKKWVKRSLSPGADPQTAWDIYRRYLKQVALETMSKVLGANHFLVVFAEGGINKTGAAEISPTLSGVYDLVQAHPDKPVLMVKIIGLNARRPWFRRKFVIILIQRYDNVSTDGGLAAFNKALEDQMNYGTPLPTRQTVAA